MCSISTQASRLWVKRFSEGGGGSGGMEGRGGRWVGRGAERQGHLEAF